MIWEKTDHWPDGRAEGGAFRGAAEVILASRGAPTLRDRMRLWWHSTPDHPFGAIARRVVLTPSWLYVETRSGGRQRAHVDALRGSRREAGRVIYAVADGEDLVVADRGGDVLERALDEKVGTSGEWRSPAAFVTVAISTLILWAAAGVAIFVFHEEGLEEIQRGLTTSESALGLYAGLGGVLLGFLFLAFFPQRYVADSLGLTSVRGLFGWSRSTIPVERIRGVVIDRFRSRNRETNRSYTHHTVELVLANPSRRLRIFDAGGVPTAAKAAAKLEESRQIARRVAQLYELSVTEEL